MQDSFGVDDNLDEKYYKGQTKLISDNDNINPKGSK